MSLRLLKADEMREAERAAFADGLSSFEAMSRAGSAVAQVVTSRWPRRAIDRVLVLCGPGNNGGDGFVAATALREAGWPVSVACVVPPDRLMGDAAKAAEKWGAKPQIATLDIVREVGLRSLVIDALFGIGLVRDIKGDVAELIVALNAGNASVIAVDMPSGIDSDQGRIMGAAVRADLTVTFGWPKRGQVLMPGRDYVGQLLIASIGLDGRPVGHGGEFCVINSPDEWVGSYPYPGARDTKYTRGHVVIGCGPMIGAARLAAAGARGVGSGMVTLLAPAKLAHAILSAEPGVVVRTCETPGSWIDAISGKNVSAVVIGSGYLPDADAREVVHSALAAKKPTVIDGGGLSAFSDDPAALFKAIGSQAVLTPHEGEFLRLFPDLRGGSKIDRAATAAKRSGAVVVLKGADTTVAAPSGRTLVSEGLPANLATAGSGDVLAGAVAAMLGLGMPAFEAAGMAVWTHGAAARGHGPALKAEDLAAALPGALADTLLWR
jgi:NAD(P)H-hydrate epimerase